MPAVAYWAYLVHQHYFSHLLNDSVPPVGKSAGLILAHMQVMARPEAPHVCAGK